MRAIERKDQAGLVDNEREKTTKRKKKLDGQKLKINTSYSNSWTYKKVCVEFRTYFHLSLGGHILTTKIDLSFFLVVFKGLQKSLLYPESLEWKLLIIENRYGADSLA